MIRIPLRSGCFAAAVLLGAVSAWADYPTGYDQAYIDAVNDASRPLTSDKIDYHLTTIGPNDHLRDPDPTHHNAILMTCFTNFTNSGNLGYSRAYDPNSSRPMLWCTVAPELWQFHQTNQTAPQDMDTRTKQLLGLPKVPNDTTTYYITEFYIQPPSLPFDPTKLSSIFRPAVNTDITNPVSQLGDIASTNAYCDWFTKRESYIYKDSQNPPIPWGRAGYTYDWGNPLAPHIGLSEFIADDNNWSSDGKKNPIWVRSVISLISYKYYVRETDSFNVTGDCNTIWMGSNFLPVTPGGNMVDIAANVTISGGEGITITDMPGANQISNVTITNAGTIRGPSKNLRDSSVYFTNTGGVLNNSGLITGDRVGVLAGDSCTRAIVINNTGTVRGSEAAIRTGAGDDRITTSGLIDGPIQTRGGNDAIYVLGGYIRGDIDGGDGVNFLNFNLPGNVTFAFASNILKMSQVNVNSGAVWLGGQVAGDVTIASGATLGGNFNALGSLGNYGTLAPGYSIGVDTIGGNYTQAYGGRLVVELARSASGSVTGDQLHVANTATLAVGSIVDVQCGDASGSVFRTGDLFHVITAGTLTDPQATVTFPSTFLDLVGSKQGNDYVLTFRNVAPFRSAAAPGNKASMAGALDGDAPTAGGAYADWLNHMLFSDAATLNAALGQLSPAAYLSISAAADRTTQYMAEAQGGYLRSRRAGQTNPGFFQTASSQGSTAFARAVGSPTELAETVKYCDGERTLVSETPDADRARSVWVNPFGVFYGERSAGDHLGFQSNVGGVQVGIDKRVSEQCIFGIGGGYDQMHINTADQFSAGKADTFRVGPYASWFNDQRYFDWSLTGGFHDNNIGRLVDVGGNDYLAHGLYHANDLSLYVESGRDYHLGAYTVSPLLSLQYIYYRQNGFAESNGDIASLIVHPLDANSLRSRLGAQVTRVQQWGQAKIVPEVFAGWAHEYLENDVLEARLIGGVTPFGIDRGGIFRDAGYYGVTLTVLPREHASLFARYNGEYSSGGHFTAVDLGAAIEF
jgi:uncharacterized protein with beta-barrel porin domain